jgi:hypothetical protein
MNLTPRGTYGKLNALGTQSGQMARNSHYFRAASIFKRRGLFQFRPYSVFSVFLADAPDRCGRIIFPPIYQWNLAKGSAMMQFNIQPYSFLNTPEGKILIRQYYIKNTPQEIELSRGQMAVFIEHLQQFIERSDAEKRRAEVEGLLKEIL